MQRIRHTLASVAPRFLSTFTRAAGYTRLATSTTHEHPERLEMSSRGSYDEKSDVKDADGVAVHEVSAHHLAFSDAQVDTAAQLVAGQDFDLDPAEAIRIRKKIDWHILPMMCSTSPRRCSHSCTGLTDMGPSALLGAVHGQDHVGKLCHSRYQVSSD